MAGVSSASAVAQTPCSSYNPAAVISLSCRAMCCPFIGVAPGCDGVSFLLAFAKAYASERPVGTVSSLATPRPHQR